MADAPAPAAELDPLEADVRELQRVTRKQGKELDALRKMVTELQRQIKRTR